MQSETIRVYLLDIMIDIKWVTTLYIINRDEGQFHYQRCNVCLYFALNSTVINKPMSEREEIKIYSELTTTVRYTDNHQIGIMRGAPASIIFLQKICLDYTEGHS